MRTQKRCGRLSKSLYYYQDMTMNDHTKIVPFAAASFGSWIFVLSLFISCRIVTTNALSQRTVITAGVDLGTSGARLSIVEIFINPRLLLAEQQGVLPVERFSASEPWPDGSYDDPAEWLSIVYRLFRQAATAATSRLDLSTIQSICISGTSASCLVVESSNLTTVVHRPRMYDYAVPATTATMDHLFAYAPSRHTTLSPTSSLSKLLDWHMDTNNGPLKIKSHHRLLHQADYVIMNLLADRSQTYSDWHNCLKLGYDVRHFVWPKWLIHCFESCHLPISVLPAHVVAPGTIIGVIDPNVAQELKLSKSCTLTAGTTDSNAAFLAATTTTTTIGGGTTMGQHVGVAVTSLGSTLALKQLSANYVEDSTLGVYSHRFPFILPKQQQQDLWLVGGASNVGCAVLRQQNYSDKELIECSQQIDPTTESPLQYYPLTRIGERFPVSDPNKMPCFEPIPDDRTEFLHGIFQGISTVERDGYMALTKLGTCPPMTILTAGGGSRNVMWTQMRQRRLRQVFPNVIVKTANHTEASFGAAVLAASQNLFHKDI